MGLLPGPGDAGAAPVQTGHQLVAVTAIARQGPFDQAGTPVEWAQSRYRGDRYKLVTRLHRGGTRVPRPGE